MNHDLISKTCKECGKAVIKGLGVLAVVLTAIAALLGVLYVFFNGIWPYFLRPEWQEYRA